MFTWAVGNGAAVCVVLIAGLCDPDESRISRILSLLISFALYWVAFCTLFTNLADPGGWEIPWRTELPGPGGRAHFMAFHFPFVLSFLLYVLPLLGWPGGWLGGAALVLIHAGGTGVLRYMLSPYWRLTAHRRTEIEAAGRARHDLQGRERSST